MKLWKCLDSKMCSQVGDLPAWELGGWRKCNPPVKVYKSGFHASRNVIDAMYNVPEVGFICSVEARGERNYHDDYVEAWSEMRVLQAWEWKKEDSVALAIYAADLVYHIFEEACPLDGRPRKAIFAAKAWLRNPSEKNRRDAEKAAEEADEIGWIAASNFDIKYKSVLSAAAAARNAARAAAANEASLAANYALGAVSATEMTFVKILITINETRENFEKVRKEVRDKFHDFVLSRLSIKVIDGRF